MFEAGQNMLTSSSSNMSGETSSPGPTGGATDTPGASDAETNGKPPTFQPDSSIKDMKKPVPRKLSRNESEKLRRDKLNMYIAELAKLVPTVASSQRKLDKSSILRLSVNYLRLHYELKHSKELESWRPHFLTQENLGAMLLEAVDGFLLIVSGKGVIVFVSDLITTMLGHSQMDLLGQSIYQLIHPEDKEIFENNLQTRPTSRQTTREDNPDVQNDKAPPGVFYSSNIIMANSDRRAFYMRMLNVNNKDQRTYEMVHLNCHVRAMPPASQASSLDIEDCWMVGVGRLVINERITELSLLAAEKMEYCTQHRMDGMIVYVDQRTAICNGYLPHEIYGSSAYDYVLEEDLPCIAFSHRKILKEGEIPSTVFRVLTKNGEIIYVQTRSTICCDRWTNAPSFILSLNQLISKTDFYILHEKQRLEMMKMEADTQNLEITSSDDEKEKQHADVERVISKHLKHHITKSGMGSGASDNDPVLNTVSSTLDDISGSTGLSETRDAGAIRMDKDCVAWKYFQSIPPAGLLLNGARGRSGETTPIESCGSSSVQAGEGDTVQTLDKSLRANRDKSILVNLLQGQTNIEEDAFLSAVRSGIVPSPNNDDSPCTVSQSKTVDHNISFTDQNSLHSSTHTASVKTSNTSRPKQNMTPVSSGTSDSDKGPITMVSSDTMDTYPNSMVTSDISDTCSSSYSNVGQVNTFAPGRTVITTKASSSLPFYEMSPTENLSGSPGIPWLQPQETPDASEMKTALIQSRLAEQLQDKYRQIQLSIEKQERELMQLYHLMLTHIPAHAEPQQSYLQKRLADLEIKRKNHKRALKSLKVIYEAQRKRVVPSLGAMMSDSTPTAGNSDSPGFKNDNSRVTPPVLSHQSYGHAVSLCSARLLSGNRHARRTTPTATFSQIPFTDTEPSQFHSAQTTHSTSTSLNSSISGCSDSFSFIPLGTSLSAGGMITNNSFVGSGDNSYPSSVSPVKMRMPEQQHYNSSPVNEYSASFCSPVSSMSHMTGDEHVPNSFNNWTPIDDDSPDLLQGLGLQCPHWVDGLREVSMVTLSANPSSLDGSEMESDTPSHLAGQEHSSDNTARILSTQQEDHGGFILSLDDLDPV